jgi:hypothetical protein
MRTAMPVLLVGGAALLLAWLLPSTLAGDGVRAGAVFMFASPDRWLAILGLGFAFGSGNQGGSRAGWAGFAGGVFLAIVARHSGVWPWLTSPSIYAYLHLLGPSACLLSGLPLVVKDRWRIHLLPFAVVSAAAMLLLTAAINDPARGGYGFGMGALLSMTGTVLLASAIRRLAAGNWMAIGERIAGSWLLTIGLLLSAVQLLPAPVPAPDMASSPAKATSTPPAIPDFAPTMRPDTDAFPAPFGNHGLPKGTN